MKQNWKSQLQEPATLEYSPLDQPPKLLAQVKKTSWKILFSTPTMHEFSSQFLDV